MTFSKTFLAVVAAVCAVLVGCSPNIQNKEAVKKGVMEYFQTNNSKIGLNLDQMAIDVTDVEFRNKEATATVAFRAKNSPTNDAAMLMKYQLEQKGDKWVVKGKTGADAHAPSTPAMPLPEGRTPSAAPPTGIPGTPTGSLPPGHPPTGAQPKMPPTGEQPKLPPNHPPVDPKKP